jgi:hypothetical protein
MISFVRPDGKKKAYVRLTADHDALDVANKVSTFTFILAPEWQMCDHGELMLHDFFFSTTDRFHIKHQTFFAHLTLSSDM